MAEHTGEFDNEPTPGGAEQIRSFLLGRLSGNEQSRLEESLFADEAFAEQVRLAEYELADDYAFQRLSAAERELFEEKFLVTGNRKRQLTVSTALRNHLAAQAALEKPARAQPAVSESRRERISIWLGFNRPALGFAFALILLVVFSSVVWRAVKNRRARQQNIAKQELIAKQRSVVTTTPELHHGPSPAPEKTHSPKPTPPSGEHESTPVLASVLLRPKAVRDGGQLARVTIPSELPGDRSIVRLELILDIEQPGSPSAELLTAEGVSVYASDQLKTSSGDSLRIVLEVPARLLKSGDYQVKLNWIVDGSVTSSRRYYFRVAQ